jgi:hypothetical protein
VMKGAHAFLKGPRHPAAETASTIFSEPWHPGHPAGGVSEWAAQASTRVLAREEGTGGDPMGSRGRGGGRGRRGGAGARGSLRLRPTPPGRCPRSPRPPPSLLLPLPIFLLYTPPRTGRPSGQACALLAPPCAETLYAGSRCSAGGGRWGAAGGPLEAAQVPRAQREMPPRKRISRSPCCSAPDLCPSGRRARLRGVRSLSEALPATACGGRQARARTWRRGSAVAQESIVARPTDNKHQPATRGVLHDLRVVVEGRKQLLDHLLRAERRA